MTCGRQCSVLLMIAAFSVFMPVFVNANAQNLEVTNTQLEARNRELQTAVKMLSKKLDQASGPLADKYAEVQLARYQHQIDLMEHRRGVFAWQLIASYMVLAIVVVVTLAGIGFSAAQLINALRLSQPQGNIDLEISASKVRITSSVVGVVVLTLSIVFLYLFLDRIYEIRELPPAAAATTQSD